MPEDTRPSSAEPGEGDGRERARREHLSARDMLALPLEERERLLAIAAVEAEVEYRTNRDLTDFEAFGEDDYYDVTPTE